jgi:hypothetical protein
LEEKALSAVRHVASQLARYDDRLFLVSKALWKAELEDISKGSVEFQGMPIAIENPAGSTRHWKDKLSGAEGTTVMQFPYGYVRGTRGADGDGYDCFVGPNPDAPFVWIVHQARPDLGNTQQDAAAIYDEDKALLGFDDVHSAVAAYKSHYDDPRFFGSMTQMSIEEFKAKLAETKTPGHDGMLKSATAPQTAAPQERFTIPLAKAGLIQALTEGTPAGMANNAVYTGVGGPNIAMGVPPRPENKVDTSPMSVTSMRAAIEQGVADRDDDRKLAIRRDPEIYKVSEITELPIRPVPEWEQRMIAGEEALKDAPENLAFVQNKLKRTAAINSEGHLGSLVPRESRERYFIRDPNAKHEVVEPNRVAKADAPADVMTSEPVPAAPSARVAKSITCEKQVVGVVTLNVVQEASGAQYEVLIKGRVPKTFPSLSAACDHVWVAERGYRDVKQWRESTGKRKVPSGAGWRFWGVDPSDDSREEARP